MVRFIFLNIAFFIISLGIFAQDEFIDLVIEPRTAEVGQEIVVTIKTNIDGNIDINLPDEFIQNGFRETGMSSSVEIINGKRKIVRYNYQSFSGYFEKEGQYLMGPVKVQTRKKEYKSESYSVRVLKSQNMISEDPVKNMNRVAFGIIQHSKKEIFEGEPLVLEGKVYSQVRVLQIEDFQPFSFNVSSETHDLNNSNQVTTEQEVVNGIPVQTFKIGKQLVYPGEVGVFEIYPFETIIAYSGSRGFFPDRMRVVSNETKVLVKPLPDGAPKEFIDAVGKFSVEANLNTHQINQGEVVELTVKVSGKGNLQNIVEPKLELPKYLSIYGDPEVNDEITYCMLGGEGSKTFTYFIQVNTAGQVQFNPVKIGYFDPESEQYKIAESKPRTITVKASDNDIIVQSKEQKEMISSPEMKPLTTDYKRSNSSSNLFDGWGSTLLLFSPIMFGALAGLFIRIKNENEEKNQEVKVLKEQKSEAMISLEELASKTSAETKVQRLSSILTDYLAKQFKVDKGLISRSFLQERVPAHLSQEVYDKITLVLDELDAIKYSGISSDSDINHLIQTTNEILNSFEE